MDIFRCLWESFGPGADAVTGRCTLLLLCLCPWSVGLSCASSPEADRSAIVNDTALPEPQVVPVQTCRIVNAFPHDPFAFTQGLVYTDGFLYEGTGLYGQSSLRCVNLESGMVLKRRELPRQFFGEGVTVWQDKIVQLTWRSKVGFVYDRQSFELVEKFNYSTEGWGLTHDGRRLIMSDGTSTLYFLDPGSFAETGQVTVQDDEGPVNQLNELEYVGGEVYANIWKTDRIARIDPASGRVLGWIDLQGLLSAEEQRGPVDVLNGIAYDHENERLFVTGKRWPKLFEIELQ